MFGKKTNEIWLIAGLGNPGLQYAETRHNAGFMAADRLAEKHNMAFNKRKFDAEYGEINLGGSRYCAVLQNSHREHYNNV